MIVIIDCGSQYTQNIARRIREIGVFCEIFPHNIDINKIKNKKPDGIIISGGPNSVYDKDAPMFDKKILNLGIPILGICYGMQSIAYLFGGLVIESTNREYGKTNLKITRQNKILSNIPTNSTVWMSHGDIVKKIPKDFSVIARTDFSIAGIENRKKNIFCVQFHPEVDNTIYGRVILNNFIEICNPQRDWTMKNYIEGQIDKIKKLVGNKLVIGGVSGGIDSSVAGVILNTAIGKNFYPIFVDNGLLRKNEAKKVVMTFKDNFNMNLRYVDAKNIFVKKLKGITDPEKKRKIIGKLFIKIFKKEAKKIAKVDFLMQGTLYPDRIESAHTKGSNVIKSHHNVGGLPKKLGIRLIEPLRDLFKDEVRSLAKILKFPKKFIFRHPFPGPGLAVRIIGDITQYRIDILQSADHIFIEELHKNRLYDKIWQAGAILLPIRSVGVMGDKRTYENVISLRAVTSLDGMTADWAKIPDKVLEKISTRIINEVKGVNRVVYDISSKPPATIEWE